MPGGDEAQVWRARLRWRLRGALQWPLFVVLMIGDTLLLHLLPIAGRRTPLVSALLLAMLFNIVAVAGPGRLAGWWLRKRRPDLPRIVSDDRAGSVVLVCVAVGLLAAGIVHTPARQRAERAWRAQAAAVRAYVGAHGNPVYRANLDQMRTHEEAPGYFRTCVPGDVGLPALCLLIRTDRRPPGVVLDHNSIP